MKNGTVITLICLFIFQTQGFCEINNFLDKDFEKNFKALCEDCKIDIQLEEEITNFLEQEQTPISLDECLDVALQNNFNIKAQFETYKSYEYLHKNALAKFLPNFNYSFYSIFYNGQVLVGTAFVDKFKELALSSTFMVSHDLTQGGKRIFDAKEKKFQKFEQKENLNYTKEEVLKLTATYYWQLLENKINIEIHIKNLHERMSQLKLAENLEATGMGTKFDVVRQKNEVASAKRSLVSAMNNFRLKQSTLANMMGIELQTTLYPIENEARPLNLVDKDINIESMFDVAYKNRKDIKAIKNKIEAMKNQKREIYTDFIPKPRIDAQYSQEGTAELGLGHAVILGAYVDIFLGENMGAGTITRAKAKAHEIDSEIYKLNQKLRNVKEELLNSYYNSKLLLKRIDITKEQFQYATETVSLAEARFDKREGDFLDIIQAQSQKTVARVENLHAIIEYNINQVELLFDQGIIDIEKIINGYNP